MGKNQAFVELDSVVKIFEIDSIKNRRAIQEIVPHAYSTIMSHTIFGSLPILTEILSTPAIPAGIANF